MESFTNPSTPNLSTANLSSPKSHLQPRPSVPTIDVFSDSDGRLSPPSLTTLVENSSSSALSPTPSNQVRFIKPTIVPADSSSLLTVPGSVPAKPKQQTNGLVPKSLQISVSSPINEVSHKSDSSQNLQIYSPSKIQSPPVQQSQGNSSRVDQVSAVEFDIDNPSDGFVTELDVPEQKNSLQWFMLGCLIISVAIFIASFLGPQDNLPFAYATSILCFVFGLLPLMALAIFKLKAKHLLENEIVLLCHALCFVIALTFFGLYFSNDAPFYMACFMNISGQSSYMWYQSKLKRNLVGFHMASLLCLFVMALSGNKISSDHGFVVIVAILATLSLVVQRFVKEPKAKPVQPAASPVNPKRIKKSLQTMVRHSSVPSELVSPLETAIRRINEIQSSSNDSNISSRLEEVLKLLGNMDLHAPTALLNSPNVSNMDAQTRDWLRTEFRNPHAMNDDYDMATKRRRASTVTGLNKSALIRVDNLNEFMQGTSTAISQVLEEVLLDWNGDVFYLAEVTNGRPLLYAAAAVFHKFALPENLGFNAQRFLTFVREIESGYLPNPYHSSLHAADVLLNIAHLLTSENIAPSLSPLDLLSVFLAAIVHDYAHPATTNNFHIQTQSTFAVIYNDKSILENYHVSKAYQVLKTEKANFLSDLYPAEQRLVRETVISLVLSTDMSLHFEHVNQFKAKIAAGKLDLSLRENKLLLLQMAIKCSDLAHMAKCLPLHLKWTIGVTNEFYNQGDEEDRLGVTRSAFMNRHDEQLPRSQIG
eukprot:TRINITY_DN6874_c0_g1_i1.p1 TRINITY_DN6874_c0_g1~~TRINITY_DN6874_c0_g1_i1.p1  ORF type:complete len:762 (-),score=115.32 TRINITY_DN6874_c0_g1_i1:1066-3351(-)